MYTRKKGTINSERAKQISDYTLILVHYNYFIKLIKKEDKRLSKQLTHCLLMIYTYKDLSRNNLYAYYSYYKLEHYLNFLIKFEYIQQNERTTNKGKVFIYYTCTNRGVYIVEKLNKHLYTFLADLKKDLELDK